MGFIKKRQVEEKGKDMTHPLPWSLSLINQVYPLTSISSSFLMTVSEETPFGSSGKAKDASF